MTARAERLPGTPGRPPLPPLTIATILELYQGDAPITDIMAQAGVCRDTVIQYAKAHGLSRVARPRVRKLRRRCSACLAISTATHCPACGAEIYVPPEPARRLLPGRADWMGAERECIACGDPFRSFHAKHVYCLPCGQARTDALEHKICGDLE